MHADGSADATGWTYKSSSWPQRAVLIGALLVVVAVVAMGEVVRPLRRLGVPAGLGVAVGTWLTGADVGLAVAATAAGLAAAALSVPRGRVADRYGAWDRVVTWPQRG